MASRSSSFLTFLLLSVFLVALSVAARPAYPHDGHHSQLRVHEEVSGPGSGIFTLVSVLDLQEPNSNELPSFQIAVRVKGELEYLYADGEKVLSTRVPNSVGFARTVWQVVEAPSDRRLESAESFAINNKDTGARLYYDLEVKSFTTAYVESGQASPLTNWRLKRSKDGSRYSLQYIQGGVDFAQWVDGDEPSIFYIISVIRPLRDIGYQIVKVEYGTKFQLTVRENGKELYLYAQEDRVLKTTQPNSVGLINTIWVVDSGPAPRSLDYADAFVIRSELLRKSLKYNGELYLTDEELAVAGWKLYRSIISIFYVDYKLTYVPYSNGNIPGSFNYLPLSSGVISMKPVA